MNNEPYVYAITDGTSIKIGVAKQPHKRLKALSTGSAAQLRLLGYFPGGFKLERSLHNRFRKVRDNGEWLYPTEDLISYLNDTITDKHLVVENGEVKSYLKTPLLDDLT